MREKPSFSFHSGRWAARARVDGVEVDLHGGEHVGRGVLGAHHVLGRPAAHVVERDDLVAAGPGGGPGGWAAAGAGADGAAPERERDGAAAWAAARLAGGAALAVDVGEDVAAGDPPAFARARDLARGRGCAR